MGAKRVINGVHVIPMGMANAFLIEGDDGLTLIDAGFPAKEAAVFVAINGISRSADQLRHLIFTHGHPDHIGSAAAIVRKTGARTYMHPLDIPIAESGGPFRPMRLAPGSKIGQAANSMKVLLQRTAGPYMWVIFDPRGRSDTSLFVRFAPKAPSGIKPRSRRFVPETDNQPWAFTP